MTNTAPVLKIVGLVQAVIGIFVVLALVGMVFMHGGMMGWTCMR